MWWQKKYPTRLIVCILQRAYVYQTKADNNEEREFGKDREKLHLCMSGLNENGSLITSQVSLAHLYTKWYYLLKYKGKVCIYICTNIPYHKLNKVYILTFLYFIHTYDLIFVLGIFLPSNKLLSAWIEHREAANQLKKAKLPKDISSSSTQHIFNVNSSL